MVFIIGIVMLAIVAAIITWSRQLNAEQRRIFVIGVLVLFAVTAALRIFWLALFFGLLALGNWIFVQTQPAARPGSNGRQPRRSKLPDGCPPDCSEADLRGAQLHGVSMPTTDFTGANLSGANLYKADLSKANLRGANLSKANLRNTNLKKAALEWSNLRGATYNRKTRWPDDFDPSQVGAHYEE